MLKKEKSTQDTFRLSLGGIKTITSFAYAHAIAHDRLRQIPVEGDKKGAQEATGTSEPLLGRFWLRRSR